MFVFLSLLQEDIIRRVLKALDELETNAYGVLHITRPKYLTRLLVLSRSLFVLICPCRIGWLCLPFFSYTHLRALKLSVSNAMFLSSFRSDLNIILSYP